MAFLQDQITSQIEGIPGLSALGQIVPVARSLVGGNIVSILLRQSILKNAFGRPRPFVDSRNVQPVFNPRIFIAGSIPVSVRSQEQYIYESQVTQHAVESGSIFSDHVILMPVRIDLSFEVSNWTYGDSKSALDALENLRNSRGMIDLQTEHKILKDMVCVRVMATNEAPEWGKLVCRATFQQIKLVTLNTVPYPKEKVTPTAIQAEEVPPQDLAQTSATSPIKRGTVQVSPLYSSESDKTLKEQSDAWVARRKALGFPQ